MIKKDYFKGFGYDPDLDYDRLVFQRDKILHFMLNGNWQTLKEIEVATGAPQASISAQLRSFRNQDGFKVKRKRFLDSGTWIYKLKNAKKIKRKMTK